MKFGTGDLSRITLSPGEFSENWYSGGGGVHISIKSLHEVLPVFGTFLVQLE